MLGAVYYVYCLFCFGLVKYLLYRLKLSKRIQRNCHPAAYAKQYYQKEMTGLKSEQMEEHIRKYQASFKDHAGQLSTILESMKRGEQLATEKEESLYSSVKYIAFIVAILELHDKQLVQPLLTSQQAQEIRDIQQTVQQCKLRMDRDKKNILSVNVNYLHSHFLQSKDDPYLRKRQI